jgi:hypothetical protein
MPESENAAGVSAPTQFVTVAGDVQYAYRRFGTGPRHIDLRRWRGYTIPMSAGLLLCASRGWI